MMGRIARAGLVVTVCFAAIVAGCAPAEPPAPERSSSSGALTTAAFAIESLDARADLVDGRGDDLLVGIDVDAPEHSDAVRTVFVDWSHAGNAVDAPWGDEAIADARIVSDATVIWLTVTGVVRESVIGGDTVDLAHDANGPLGISPSGRYVAWTAGEAPEVDVRRLDRATGAVDVIAPDEVPSWSPVPFDDGSVAFVLIRDSLPQRAVVEADGTLRIETRWSDLASVGAVPTGPGLPSSSVIAWSREQGTASRPGRAGRSPSGRSPASVSRGSMIG